MTIRAPCHLARYNPLPSRGLKREDWRMFHRQSHRYNPLPSRGLKPKCVIVRIPVDPIQPAPLTGTETNSVFPVASYFFPIQPAPLTGTETELITWHHQLCCRYNPLPSRGLKPKVYLKFLSLQMGYNPLPSRGLKLHHVPTPQENVDTTRSPHGD